MNKKQPVFLFLSSRNTIETISEILTPGFELRIHSKPDDLLKSHVSLIITDDLMLRQYHQQIELKKQDEKQFDLPVLLVTSNDENSFVSTISGRSFDEIITIPIQKTELLKRVETLLRLRRYSIETGHLKDELDTVRKLHTDLALQDANIGMWDWNLETRELNYSPIWKKQLGCSASEIKNSIDEWESRLHPEDRESAVKKQDQFIKDPKGKLVQEFRLQHKDGSYRWILSTASLHKGENGRKTRLLGTHIDITDHKRAEKELLKSEKRFKLIFEHSLAAMLLIDPDTHQIVSANKAAEKFYGWTRTELRQMKVDDINILTGEEIQNEIDKARKSERIYFRFKHRLASRQIRDVEVYTSNVEIDDHTYLFSIIHDISEQKRAEEELKLSEERFRLVFESANVGKSVTALNGIIDVNQAFCEMLGYSKDELKNKRWQELTPPEDVAGVEFQLRELINGEKDATRFFKRYIHKNGNYVWTDVSVRLMRDDTGNPLFFITTIIDITGYKTVQAERERLLTTIEVSLNEIYIFSADNLRFMYANQGALQNLGYSLEQLKLMTPVDIKPQFNETTFRSYIRPLTEQQVKKLVFQTVHQRSDSSVYPVEVNLQMVNSEEGYLFIAIINDITERKKSEEIVAESERKYRYLFANNPMPMWIYDLETLQFLEVNEAAIHHYGYSEKEFRSMTLEKIRPVEEIARLMKDVRINHPEINKAGIWQHIKKNGETIFVEIISHAITYENKPARLVLANDVTERKKAETALKESEERYKSLLDEAPVGIAVHAGGNIVFVNPAGTRLLKAQDAKQLIGMSLDTIIHPDNLDDAESRIKRLIAGEKGLFPVEDIYRCLDGTEINVEVTATLLAYNHKPAVQVIISDITDRKRKEREISLLNKRLEILIESIKQLAAAQTIENVQQIVTDAGRKLVNSDGSAIVFQDGGDCYYAFENTNEPLWQGSRFPAEECISGWVMTNQEPAIIEDIYQDPRIPLEIYKTTFVKSLVMVPVTGIEVIGAIGNYFKNRYLPTDEEVKLLQTLADAAATAIGNIRLYNELEERVNQRTRQLQAANKELETFTYSVSHDLKAPLRGIDGYSKLLVDLYGDQMNDEAKHFIGIIRNSTLQMNRLIDDLLSYSRLERSHLRKEKIDFASFLQSILNTYRKELEETAFEVEIMAPDVELVADSTGLSVILRNFIENAIKFTKNNSNPKIQIVLSDSEDSWIISVKDNGIGFDMKYHNRIFDIFQRLHRAEDFPGTGIGLALVGKAIGRMGGKTWANSAPGEGATFFVEIPKSFTYDTK